VGQLYQEGYDDAVAHGADATKAHEAGLKNAPAAGLEFLGDKLIVGRILKPLKGKIKVKDVLKAATASAASEGLTEGAQQVWQNFNAATLTGYDPERKVDDDVYHSALIGAIVGGIAAGSGQGARAAFYSQRAAQAEGRSAGGTAQGTEAGTARKVDALGKLGVENPDESVVDRMNRSLAKQLNELDAQKAEGRATSGSTQSTAEATGLQPKSLSEILAQAAQQSDAQRAAIQAEEKAREERLAAAKERREQFEHYLEMGRKVLAQARETEGRATNGSTQGMEAGTARAAVKGVLTTLRAYVDDKSLALPLAQQNEALALIRDLKPIHEKLQAKEDALAAVRITQAKAQAEREAAERKARIKEEKRALKEDDKQRIENLSDDALWALMESEDPRADAAEAELNRREKQQLVPTTDEDDLLTVLRRVKLPTRDDSGRGLQGELDSLKNEGVNFGTRMQLFDSKQGSLDRTAEKLRGEGFNQIQNPDDVIEFTKRALAGERILPQVQFDPARKARSDDTQTHAPDDRLPHESQADTPDPFTGERSFIGGSRVTAAQAIQLAGRVRSLQSLVAQSDTGRTGKVEAAQLRDLEIPWLTIRRAEGRLINTQTGQSLPEIGHGVEAYAYVDEAQGVVYKVYQFGESSDESVGIRLAIEEGMVGTDTGRPRDVIEKTWVINDLGGTPTEIVGFTQDGEIVVKQPRGRRAQDTASAEPSPFDRAQAIIKAHLQEVPASVLPRIDMRSPLYYSHIAGQDVLLGDLHGKNFIGDTIGRGRINDLATHVLTAEELAKLPKLNAWLAERRSAAQAQGSMDFARRGNTAEGRGGNDSAQSMAADTVHEQSPIVAADFENRLKRIAPGLMLKYKALVGDYDSLFSPEVGVRPWQVDGTEQAAHIVGAKTRILWFLQQNLRADKNGLMDERLRRDMLHEASHAWLNTLERERKEFLVREWQRDIKSSDGWLAQMRRDKVELRKGVATDWQEYWCERIAYENNEWASKREHWGIAGDRGLLAQIYAEFRRFLADALDLLQRAFTRTKRYNIDFRSFLTDARYAQKAEGRARNNGSLNERGLRPLVGPSSIARQLAAARAKTREAHRQFLAGEPVVELDGTQFQKSDPPLNQRVAQWFEKNYQSKVTVPAIGEVRLDKAAVNRSISHGIGRDKVAGFAAVPDVLTKGRVIHSERMHGSTEGLVYHIAAPIRIAGRDFVAAVLIKSDSNLNRLYVHEVFLKEKLQNSVFKNGAVAAEQATGKRTMTESGAIQTVLRDLYDVNKDVDSGQNTHADFARKAAQTREQIQRVIDAAKKPSGHAPEKADLGPVADWVAQAVQEKLGLDVSAYRHTLDGSAVRHILNKHGDSKVEEARGQIAVTDEDIQHLPTLVTAPDSIVLGTKTNGHKDQVAFIKRMPDGTSLYLEEVRQGRGALAAVSMRKYPEAVRTESILKTLQEESQKANPVVENQAENSGHKTPATRDTSATSRTLPSNAQSDGGNKLTVVDAPHDVKADTVQVDFARKADDSPKLLSREQRLARNLHELEELNYRIDELKDAQTRQQKDAYRRLLGERNEKRMFIDAEFSGWRKTHPELADGQVLDAKATRKRILEKDLREAEKKAATGNTFAEKRAAALRRTLQREYPETATNAEGRSGNDTAPNMEADTVRNDASQRAQARAELVSMSPVPVSGLDPTLTGKPLRTAAHEAYKEAADKGPVQMRDGRLVELTTVGFKKVRSHSADRRLLDLFPSIREVLGKAVPIASLPHVPVDHTDSIKAWHYYGAKVAFGKQELYAKLVVRESVNGEIYYDTNFSSLEEAVARDGDAIPDKPEAAPRLSDDMHTLSELLAQVKPADEQPQGRGFNESPATMSVPAASSINAGRDHAVVPPLLGHTNIPPKPGQTVWQWLTDFIKGFRNFVPEVSPRDQNYAPLRQFYKAIKRATPQNQARVQDILGSIVKPLLDAGMGKAEADTYRKLGLIQQRIRKLERNLAEGRGGNDASQAMTAATGRAGAGKPQVQAKNAAELARLHAQVVQLNAQLEAQPYHLFNKIVLAEDYVWRAENLKDEKTGQVLALPDGITLDQAKAEAARLQALAQAHPQAQAINRAVQAHLELVGETWAELERRFPELKAVPTNPYYFPHHIINDKHPAKLARVRLDTAAELRKYLIEPKGSVAPIETDYAAAMALHLSAVYAHNSRADLVRDLIKKQYDKMDELRERAKELSEERGERVGWQGVFDEEYKHSGYVKWTPDDRLHLHSEAIVSREKLAKRLGVALGDADLQTELAKAGITQVQLLPTDIREALVPNEKETWIIPEKVAQALEAMIERESRFEGSDLGSRVARSLEAAQNLWKKHILFSPWNYIRYEYNNTTSDLEKLFSADPEVFGYLPSALREVLALYAPNAEGRGGNDASQTMAAAPSREARIAQALGVMQSVTIREAGDLPQLKQFAALKARPERLRDIAKAASTLFLANGRSTIELSQLREATFRYTKFKADLNRMRNGARPVYAGAYHKDIEALVVTEDHLNTIKAIIGDRATNAEGHGGNEDVQKLAADTVRAAEISLATFGDYDTISVSGAALRKMMIPFYSWIEINFRYHANLFRNLKDMVKAGEMAKADARKAGARAAGVLAATFTRKVAAYTAGRLLLPYLAVAMWNNSGDNEEIEDELSEADRRRFHINLGRDKDGRARVVYAATALGDVMKWFGGDDLFRLGADLMKGRTTLAKAVEHYSTQFLPDLVNNLAGGIGPVVKAGYTLASGKSTFPDITDQRTIPAYDLKWNVLSQMTDGFTADMIRRVLDKDYLALRDLGDWVQQLILQVRKRDAASWSFYAIKDKAADWNERRTGKSRGSSDYNSPEMQVLRNYRRAIYKGDVKNAVRFYDRLLEFGYTAERLRSSIRSQDPLSEIPKELRREFVASLSPFEQRQLERAYIHYAKMNSLRGYETQLFPRANQPLAWQKRHRPRYDILERQITGHGQLSGEELAKRAHKAMMESLQ